MGVPGGLGGPVLVRCALRVEAHTALPRGPASRPHVQSRGRTGGPTPFTFAEPPAAPGQPPWGTLTPTYISAGGDGGPGPRTRVAGHAEKLCTRAGLSVQALAWRAAPAFIPVGKRGLPVRGFAPLGQSAPTNPGFPGRRGDQHFPECQGPGPAGRGGGHTHGHTHTH